MILAHLRMRRRVSLLATRALHGAEEAETRAHVESCPGCSREYEELARVVAALDGDPVRTAEPELPLSALVDRVERSLDRPSSASLRAGMGWGLALPAAAAALVALVFLGAELLELGPGPSAREPVTSAPGGAPASTTAVPGEVLDRLERNVAREQAARYLSEAQDVLLAVAASEIDCHRRDGRVDVGEAPDRSRELLARRALIVEDRPEAVASARAVLDDVELALREVADLPSCVRRRDVRRLRQEIDRQRLHMRIRLMTRELEG